MKTLVITCKSTDEDDDFQTELNIIIEQLSAGWESGHDIWSNKEGTNNSTNSYHYSVEYT